MLFSFLESHMSLKRFVGSLGSIQAGASQRQKMDSENRDQRRAPTRKYPTASSGFRHLLPETRPERLCMPSALRHVSHGGWTLSSDGSSLLGHSVEEELERCAPSWSSWPPCTGVPSYFVTLHSSKDPCSWLRDTNTELPSVSASIP